MTLGLELEQEVIMTRLRPSLAVFAVVLLTVAVVGCGGSTSDEGSTTSAGATSSTEAPSTTTESPTTATTDAPTTTTAPATTTTAPDPDAWFVDGVTFVAGQCFATPDAGTGSLQSQAGELAGVLRISTGAVHPTEVVACGGPHAGEIVATGSDCPVGEIGGTFDMTNLTKGFDPSAIAGAFATYVGVDIEDLPAWLAERSLTMRFHRQADDRSVITATMCLLGAVEGGQLTGSYAATN